MYLIKNTKNLDTNYPLTQRIQFRICYYYEIQLPTYTTKNQLKV